MNSIQAIWLNGTIVLAGPVDWPEGSKLIVRPLDQPALIGMTEQEWDAAAGLAEWEAAVRAVEPLEYGEAEQREFERYAEESRRANREAVRQQMELNSPT